METVVSLPVLIMFTSWHSAESRSHQMVLKCMADSLFSLISLFCPSLGWMTVFAFFPFPFQATKWRSQEVIKKSQVSQVWLNLTLKMQRHKEKDREPEWIFITQLWRKFDTKAFGNHYKSELILLEITYKQGEVGGRKKHKTDLWKRLPPGKVTWNVHR